MHAAFVIRYRSPELMSEILQIMFRQSSSKHTPFMLVTWPADPRRHAFMLPKSRSAASLGSCKAKQRLWWPEVPCQQPMANLNVLGKCQRLGAAAACDFVLIGF